MKIGERAGRLFGCSPWLQAPLHAMCSKKKCSRACMHSWRRNEASLFFYNVNRNKLRIQGSKNWEKTWRNLSANYWQQVLYMKGPTLWQPFERKISFPFVFVCLFVFICHPHFSFSPSYLLFSCYPHFFLSSPIRRYARGTRFTDTPWLDGITFFGKTTTTTTSTRLDKNKKEWNAYNLFLC